MELGLGTIEGQSFRRDVVLFRQLQTRRQKTLLVGPPARLRHNAVLDTGSQHPLRKGIQCRPAQLGVVQLPLDLELCPHLPTSGRQSDGVEQGADGQEQL